MGYQRFLILAVLCLIMPGCASVNTIPVLGEEEAFKYEKKYLAEYEALKSNYTDTSIVRWVQPANKNIPCKLYVRTYQNADVTHGVNYKIFWDGDCKNGYANGLGREFERDTVLNREALAIYKENGKEPEYYIQKDHLEKLTAEGNNNYIVETKITDDNFNFDMSIRRGYTSFNEKPSLFVTSYPLSDAVRYTKQYPNFSYQMIDYLDEEFQAKKAAYYVLDNVGNGFVIEAYNDGHRSAEIANGKIIRVVQLPSSYIKKSDVIIAEIEQAGKQADEARQQALIVKKQYTNKICKESVVVDFIDNEEYKAICNEEEDYAKLKEKYDSKMAQISSQKQQKREQLNQQKIIDAQVTQANAAARSAAAAEQANNMQSWQNLNNQIQNTQNTTNQILQQTNAYSYPSITPFSGINNLNSRKIRTCYTAGGIEFCN